MGEQVPEDSSGFDTTSIAVALLVLLAQFFAKDLNRTCLNVVWHRIPWVIPLTLWGCVSYAYRTPSMLPMLLAKLVRNPGAEKWITKNVGMFLGPTVWLVLYLLFTAGMVYWLYGLLVNTPLSARARQRLLEYGKSLYDVGYLDHQEYESLCSRFPDEGGDGKSRGCCRSDRRTRSEVQSAILGVIKDIRIGSPSIAGDKHPQVAALLNFCEKKDEAAWPRPISTGPLSPLVGQLPEPAGRVWLAAVRRVEGAKFSEWQRLRASLMSDFSWRIARPKSIGRVFSEGEMDVIRDTILVAKIRRGIPLRSGDDVSAGGMVGFQDFKTLWSWYDAMTCLLCDDGTFRKAWERRWLIGVVSPSEASQHVQKHDGPGGVLFRFSTLSGSPTFNFSITAEQRGVKVPITIKPKSQNRYKLPFEGGENKVAQNCSFESLHDLLEATPWKTFLPSAVAVTELTRPHGTQSKADE